MNTITNNIAISKWLLKWGGRVYEHPLFWRGCGRFESWMLQDQLEAIEIKQPIYICGLARSGSTVLLEILNSHFNTHSFCYEDFPFVHLPWFWSIKSKMDNKHQVKRERAHQDGMYISGKSPEALEELLWMNYYPELHSVNSSHLFDAALEPEFCRYYSSSIKKLLYAHNATRYLSKGNYNVGRIKALLTLFPDAKFIIPIRSPIEHIASLIKQHKLFVNLSLQDTNVVKHLAHMGHFEFGPHRVPSNFGDLEESATMVSLFNSEQNVLAYAKQWSMTYGYLLTLLNDKEVRGSLHLVRYEDLCLYSLKELSKLFDFCRLDQASLIIHEYESKLFQPTYYCPDFTKEEIQTIHSETHEIASCYGYNLYDLEKK